MVAESVATDCVAVTFADGVESANVVGYQTVNVKAGQWYMVAAQFQGCAETTAQVALPDLITTTCTPGASGDFSDPTWNNAPAIQILNEEGTGYKYYFYINDAGIDGSDSDPWSATGWASLDDGLLTNVKVNLAKGFWFKAMTDGTITCSGQVCAADSFERAIPAGQWEIVSNPFPTAIGLADVVTTGFTPGASGDFSDPTWNNAPAIQILNNEGTGYKYYFYINDAGIDGSDSDPWSATGWASLDDGLLTTGTQLGVGQAFWINSKTAGTLTFEK